MEEPELPNHPKPTNTLFSFILIILTLILLSLFPYHPPAFITQTLVSNLWGLIRLLFIGLGVAYGLLGRRNTGTEPIYDANERYLSGFLQFSSVFDDGFFENADGFDEKLMVQLWKRSPVFDKVENPRSEYSKNGFEMQSGSVAIQKCVLGNRGKPNWVDDYKPLNLPIRSLGSNILENSCVEEIGTNLGSERFCKKNMSQIQNYDYRYFNDESTAIDTREKHVLDNLGKPKKIDDYKPLNLPVRSLRLKIMENSYAECVEEVATNSVLERFCKKTDEIEKIGGLVPINLEKKFEEVVALPSPIPWSSRSSRIEVTEKFKPPSHTRLSSIGVYEFDKMRLKETRLGQNQVGEDAGNVGFSSLGDFEFEKYDSQSIPNMMKVSEVKGGSEVNPNTGEGNSRTHSIEKYDSESIRNTMKVSEVKGESEVNPNTGKGNSRIHSRAVSAKELDYTKVEPRSDQIKVRGEKRNAKSPPCVKPSSVGEFGNNKKKLESRADCMETRGKKSNTKSLTQSETFWSSIYSPIDSVSPSPNKSSPLSAISTDEQNPKFEDLKKEDSSFSSISTDTLDFSTGSSFKMNFDRNSDSSLRTSNKSTREEKEEKTKQASPNKSLPRGKSVRTIRTNISCLIDKNKEKSCSDLMDEKVEKANESSKLCKYQNGEKQEFYGSNKAQMEKKSDGIIQNFKASSGEKVDSTIADYEELETDEVDKKADAFIAKFKEQIRLQKIDSIKRKR